MKAQIKLVGGLEVTVEYSVMAAEPEWGIMSPCVEDWAIVEIKGKACKSADWLYDRIYATPGEEERIFAALLADYKTEEQDAEEAYFERLAESRGF